MLFIKLFLGLIFLIVGAEYLVRIAIIIGRRYSLSETLIGIIIVGFGTSLCELFVSIDAVINDASELSLGNIIGSNIANILLVIGISSLYQNFKTPKLSNLDISMHLISTIIFTSLCFSYLINVYWGLFFVTCFVLYLLIIFRNSNSEEVPDDFKKSNTFLEKKIFLYPIFYGSLSILICTILIFSGTDITVKSAIEISKILGISESIIGLSLIAVGTSLPEIASSISAAKKKKFKIIFGNIVGSNLYNILLVIGSSTFFNDYIFRIENISKDLIVLNICLFVFSILVIKQIFITKLISVILLLAYFLYLSTTFYKVL